MGKIVPSRLRVPSIAAAAALVLTSFLVAQPALADTAPVDPTSPASPTTVSADSLPTPQINGVVWTQKIVGNTVYAGGDFTTAQPAGAAAGANTVTRTDILAYDVTTGVLNTSFAPSLNGQVKSIAISPDGSRLYVGGSFTTVNGATQNRVVALNPTTGATIAGFAPSVNATVNAIVPLGNTVYLGGAFTGIGSSVRQRAAAVSTSGALLGWAPDAEGGAVSSMVASPDGTKIVLGGSYTSLNGSADPGYGLAAVDPTSAALLPWAVDHTVRNGGPQAGITSLTADADGIYGSGYVFGDGGNLEGSFRADWATGALQWVEDCHGDSYSVATTSNAVYLAGHPHYCGNIGGFPQTSPTWTFHRGLAFGKVATGTITPDPYGYFNWAGTAHPSLLNWFPDFNTGTFTGQNQGPWSVATNSQYVVYGGEFTTVNGVRQQGLTRFAVKSIAPNKQGPMITGNKFIPTAVSLAPGSARVSWPANWDRDNTHLTYAVYRNGNATPVYQTAADSTFWNQPLLGFTDTGLTPGATYTYRVSATDPLGNTIKGDSASVTITSKAASAYANSVLGQGATDFWRLDEASGSAVYDAAGYNDQVAQAGVTRGAAGGTGDSDTASTFSGDSTGLSATQTAIAGPQTFSVEAWFKTTTTSGGKIVGFGNTNTGTSSSYDRHIFMESNGKVDFGVYNGNTSIVQSPTALNDGAWHQVIGTLSSGGMQFYVDGALVGTRADVTSAQDYSGYWRIGGDSSWSGANFFSGSIDDVSVYATPLTQQQVDAQWVAAGHKTSLTSAPADSYGNRVFTDNPVAYFRLDDAAGSTSAVNSSLTGANAAGIYTGGVTQGVAGALTGNSDTAASFDGSTGQVSTSQAFSDPEVYSVEAWFKTTTTTGGKIIGFGDAQTGSSGSYDRHVYMQDNGQLVFGTYTGQENTITTNASYNDGNWHAVVATQSSAGLKLYVDGTLAGTNPTTNAQAYTGYWKIGGDTTWGSSSNYFQGSIDEAAVYDRALDASTVSQHYALGAGAANAAPTAAFTSTTSDLKATFDGSTSADIDGSVASYAWDFGDGGTSTAVKPAYTYAAAGTYTVKLTVTDDKGATGVTTATVTVTAHVNVAPTSSFTSTPTGLAVAFDGSASSDTDGTIASYAWDFGDNSTGVGAKPSHTYAASGTYPVTLTVTDDGGLTSKSTATVTVTRINTLPTAAISVTSKALTASFDGSGSSDPDGTITSYAWNFGDNSTGSGSTVSHAYVSAGTYQATLTVTDNDGGTATTTTSVTVAPPANVPPTAVFTSSANALALSVDGSSSTDSDGTVTAYSWNFGDGASATGKTASHAYAAAGSYTVGLTVTDNSGASATTSQTITVSKAPNVLPTASFSMAPTGLTLAVDGSSSSDPDGTIASYAWNFGDGSTASGATASHSYASAGTYSVTLTVTDDDGGKATSTQSATVSAPVNVAPTAAFTSTVTGLVATTDATASSDPDGTIASYAWDFGDGTAATSGKTASHTYAVAGTYTVTLTVTDNQGAKGTTTQTVSPIAPTAVPFAVDHFGRTVSNGFGTADTGGIWTKAGTASNLGVSSGNGTLALPTAGTQVGAYLYGVSQTNTDLRVQFSLNKAATGGGTYFSAIGRAVSTNNEYKAQVNLSSTGQANLSLLALKGSSSVTTLVASKTVPGITVAAGTNLTIRTQVTGTGTTTIRAKVWVTGTTEPTAWTETATDTYAPLQTAGGVGVLGYVSGTATNVPQVLSVQELSAFQP